MTVAEINKLIQELPSEERGKISDSYHTIEELYEHRIELFIALCRLQQKYNNDAGKGKAPVWKSKLHSDGTGFEGWFIMGISDVAGDQITYHLPMSKWDWCFFAETLDKAPHWDGHNSKDVLNRLKTL